MEHQFIADVAKDGQFYAMMKKKQLLTDAARKHLFVAEEVVPETFNTETGIGCKSVPVLSLGLKEKTLANYQISGFLQFVVLTNIFGGHSTSNSYKAHVVYDKNKENVVARKKVRLVLEACRQKRLGAPFRVNSSSLTCYFGGPMTVLGNTMLTEWGNESQIDLMQCFAEETARLIQTDALRFALHYGFGFKQLKHMYQRATICIMALKKMLVAGNSNTHPELVCTSSMFYINKDNSRRQVDTWELSDHEGFT